MRTQTKTRSTAFHSLLLACLAALLQPTTELGPNSSLQGQAPPSPLLVAGPLSPRVVAYGIDARLQPDQHRIDATMVLTYRNRTGRPLQEFPFHLYLNAFQPGSTFMREARRDNPDFEWKEKYRGSIEVLALEAVGMGDLTQAMEFVQPDDRNPDDKTVFRVRLPRAISPGEAVEFRFVFRAQLPQVLARTGYKRDFHLVAQWFPKVGVWWQGEWNCHQFHRSTEFFADFGTYDVKLTIPQKYVVGATGVEAARADNSDGSWTYTFRAEDVHDLAWTADPNFKVIEESWTGSAGRVAIRLLMSPGHMNQAQRYLQALNASMQLYDRWYGPYPYSQITVVDPPHGAFAAGGMEYPTFITAGTLWWMPAGLRVPEVITVHEFGHQYWYGMVASNELEDAWLDEGVNQYVESKIMAALYGEKEDMIDLLGGNLGDADITRFSYVNLPDTDPIVRSGYQYMTGRAYGAVTYMKTASVLRTLEGIVGEETVQRALRTYFSRFRFRHPTEDDFLQVLEEVAEMDLDWFVDQAVRGTQVLDYAVQIARSDKGDHQAGDRSGVEGDKSLYHTQVVVHRKGDFVLPVEIEIKFEDGTTVREHWDGRDRWVRYTYAKPSRIISAEIDPDHTIWLDINRFNDSRTAKTHGQARNKLSTYWLLFTEFLSQALAWLA